MVQGCAPADFSCSAMDPFIRSMECIPEDDENNENENPIIASIHKSFNKGTSNVKFEATAKLQTLKTRLDAFWSKGWLSKQEYQQHTEFLSTFDVSCIGSNGKYALKELEKEFDTMEEQKSHPAPQSWSDMFMSTLGVSTSKNTKTSTSSSGGLSSFWSNSMAVSVSEDDADSDYYDVPTPLATATNRSVNGVRAPTIVTPRGLSNVLSDHAVADLFVETCFFARLGFVQPPCCMSCTYREALKGNIPDMECSTWVVWRKNANRNFDPSNNINMSDNAVVVQCKSARKLVAGKMVDGYQWNAEQKMLLRRK